MKLSRLLDRKAFYNRSTSRDADIAKLKEMLASLGIKASSLEVEWFWQEISAHVCAGWLRIPESADGLISYLDEFKATGEATEFMVRLKASH